MGPIIIGHNRKSMLALLFI